jgi:hypothetical protein
MMRAALVAATALVAMAGASSAPASVTLGQIAPTTPTTNCSNTPVDWVQPTVVSGNSYEVPATGTITSWSTRAAPDAGQNWTMKIYRRVSGSTYTVMGHDGPRPLAAGLNTFTTSIPVQSGDLLGMNSNSVSPLVSTTCTVAAPGNTAYFGFAGNPDDGEPATITGPVADRHLNISAVFEPTNTFSLGTLTRNRKKGTATLTVTLPNPGELTGSAAGVTVSAAGATTRKPVAAGTATLLVKATGKKKRKLRRKGRAKVKLVVTYTPTGGDPSSQTLKMKLRKRR